MYFVLFFVFFIILILDNIIKRILVNEYVIKVNFKIYVIDFCKNVGCNFVK